MLLQTILLISPDKNQAPSWWMLLVMEAKGQGEWRTKGSENFHWKVWQSISVHKFAKANFMTNSY